MNWTWTNAWLIGGGLILAAVGVLLFRFRTAARQFIIDQQTSMFGDRVGEMMKRRTTPMTGVGVPAIFSMAIGAVWVLLGIFAHVP